ncbi:protein sprouty homolog 4 [Rhincodon typus]|uniref:protein sprouty homolog 4 n=1 Tax=Rhincodon typus TaxID=259920 RepID=UPI0009A261BA|nr:protein sprouty homolog 4 [Rhincodon typus]XP_020365413.1 protein sprouty homolog 4 [Rhincodon typus]XP_020365415.1 protein sprouty homolog 4 [Rhincodon typus]XP_048459728.1 protein sprouty homolog 4 [Rhincodon typus]XP_048459729.1 protein sprouty homolog 4 [Rhincodon typus]
MERRVSLGGNAGNPASLFQPFLDGRLPYGRLQHTPILPMDQMKPSRLENDYVENPVTVQPCRNASPQSRSGQPPESTALSPREPGCEHSAMSWGSVTGRPSSISSSSSTSSDQRLLDHAAPPPVAEQQGCPRAVRSQPKSPPSINKGVDLKETSHCQESGKHVVLCEGCGKCKCSRCISPRTLPFCWVCSQRCLCSPQKVVNYATCMCLVTGIFYHCTNDDDERSCADHPCSCSHSNCGARWCCMGAMSVFLPCLLCYLPATGCVKLSQKFYDTVSRPGCRCKNSNSVYCKVPEVSACSGEKPSS